MLDNISAVIQKYNEVADQYAKKIANLLPKKRLDNFINKLSKSPKVLEIGSAAGRDTKYLYENGVDVVGIDLSENLVQIAKKSHPQITFQVCDMRKLPFKNSYFDGVWANAVFHHLDKSEMESTLQEWSRVLKDDGIIQLSTKMGEGNWQGKDSLSVGQEREFTLLMPEELESMFKKINFKKIALVTEKDATRNLYWIHVLYRK